jgi:hypothetical protein
MPAGIISERRALLAGLAVGVAAAAGASLSADGYPALDLAAMVERADAVVVARALAERSIWMDGELVTVVTAEVERQARGKAPQRIELVLPGGLDLDRPVPIAVVAVDAPELPPDTRALLFLRRVPGRPGHYILAAGSQALLPIERDGSHGDQVTCPPAVGGGVVPLDTLLLRLAIAEPSADLS